MTTQQSRHWERNERQSWRRSRGDDDWRRQERKHSNTIDESSQNWKTEIHRRDEEDRTKGDKWKQSDQDQIDVTNKGTSEKTNVQTRWNTQEYKWMHVPDYEHYAPTPALELMKGILSYVATTERDKYHVVTVVHVRRVYFYAESLSKRIVELSEYWRLRYSDKMSWNIERLLKQYEKECMDELMRNREWISDVWHDDGKDIKIIFQIFVWKLMGVVHDNGILLAESRSLTDTVRKFLRKRYETR